MGSTSQLRQRTWWYMKGESAETSTEDYHWHPASGGQLNLSVLRFGDRPEADLLWLAPTVLMWIRGYMAPSKGRPDHQAYAVTAVWLPAEAHSRPDERRSAILHILRFLTVPEPRPWSVEVEERFRPPTALPAWTVSAAPDPPAELHASLLGESPERAMADLAARGQWWGPELPPQAMGALLAMLPDWERAQELSFVLERRRQTPPAPSVLPPWLPPLAQALATPGAGLDAQLAWGWLLEVLPVWQGGGGAFEQAWSAWQRSARSMGVPDPGASPEVSSPGVGLVRHIASACRPGPGGSSGVARAWQELLVAGAWCWVLRPSAPAGGSHGADPRSWDEAIAAHIVLLAWLSTGSSPTRLWRPPSLPSRSGWAQRLYAFDDLSDLRVAATGRITSRLRSWSRHRSLSMSNTKRDPPSVLPDRDLDEAVMKLLSNLSAIQEAQGSGVATQVSDALRRFSDSTAADLAELRRELIEQQLLHAESATLAVKALREELEQRRAQDTQRSIELRAVQDAQQLASGGLTRLETGMGELQRKLEVVERAGKSAQDKLEVIDRRVEHLQDGMRGGALAPVAPLQASPHQALAPSWQEPEATALPPPPPSPSRWAWAWWAALGLGVGLAGGFMFANRFAAQEPPMRTASHDPPAATAAPVVTPAPPRWQSDPAFAALTPEQRTKVKEKLTALGAGASQLELYSTISEVVGAEDKDCQWLQVEMAPAKAPILGHVIQACVNRLCQASLAVDGDPGETTAKALKGCAGEAKVLVTLKGYKNTRLKEIGTEKVSCEQPKGGGGFFCHLDEATLDAASGGK